MSELDRLFGKNELEDGRSARILDAVMARIDRRRTRAAFGRLGILAALALASFGATVQAIGFLSAESSRTGLTEVLSLPLSDFGLIVSSWQTFAWSVIEALPAAGLAALFGSVFLLLTALRLMDQFASVIRRHSHN